MKLLTKTIHNEEKGSALIIGLMIVAILSIIAINTIKTTNTEIQISGNDKWQKEAYTHADGGTHIAIQLVELCEERAGFDDANMGNFVEGDITGSALNLYMDSVPNVLKINDTNRSAVFPRNALPTQPHTNISIGSRRVTLKGDDITADNGYDAGKTAGTARAYVLLSQRLGANKAESAVRLDYTHVF